MNKFDDARYEFYLKHPEAILNIGEWETNYFCKRCDTVIKNANLITQANAPEVRFYVYPSGLLEYQCPGCGALNATRLVERYSVSIFPYRIIKQRYLTTRITYSKKWFKTIETREGFWEREILYESN
jgi:hypothetical protein